MEGSEIGIFGTLRLMKRTTNEQVAAFPIDEETVTFGRDPTCSVRLYYPDISALHAKIVFQERKAFLIVLGDIGLTIDGCPVLPSANPSLPTTIPVSNNCEIEIRKKRFVFSYPPKQLRTPLYNIDTPLKPDNEAGGRRKLRMSMIHSAQVFTPRGRPSSDPLANLRVLQSPIKQLVPSPRKPSALKNSHLPEPDEVEEEIVLVESNSPHVVQEEKDLVILERVDVPAPLPPTPLARRSRPSVNMYQTPNRRTRPSLHRAVLIRSIQRAVMAREEEQEEKEVEDVIVGEETAEQCEEYGNEEEHDEHDNEHAENDDEGPDEDEHSDTDEVTPQPSTWRKSLDAVRARVGWPFRSSSTVPEEYDEDNEDEDGEEEHIQLDTDQDAQPPPPSSSPPIQTIVPQVQPHVTPARAPRPLGSFMTPQVSHLQSGVGVGRGAGRNSFGGALRVPLPPGASTLAPPGASALEPTGAVDTWGGAKRVRVEPKWRIGEIEVGAKEEENVGGLGMGRKRASVTEEERKAIQERRKSALTIPDPFFAQVPGLRRLSVAPSDTPKKLPSLLDSAARTVGERITSPTKLGERSVSPTKLGERSVSPTKLREESASPTKAPYLSRPTSPTKSFHPPMKAFESPARAYVPFGRSVSPVKVPLTPHSEEDEEDTRSLLDRMKRTVDEIKRRRSVGPFGHDDGPEDEEADTIGTERHGDVEDNEEADYSEDHQAAEEEENSDKENGRASPLLLPPLSPERELDLAETSPHTPTPLSPTCIALDLDLELERTPLPQLTRPAGASRRQHTSAFSGLQTPALTSVKHLFPPPAAVTSTPAVKSMRALFRGAGKGAKMGIREEALEGVEEMMLTPEGYRAQDEDVFEQGIAEAEQEQERTRSTEKGKGKEKEERQPAKATTSRKPPVPVPASAPTTIAARRRTTRTVMDTGVTGSNSRGFSTSRPVARTEAVPSKRAQMALPKRAEKEKETEKEVLTAMAMAPEPEPEPAPGVSAEERDDVAPQLTVQKKPVKARLLRARKGVATETSDGEPAAVPKTRDAGTEPRTRPASTEPRTRAATATTTRKAQADDVNTVPRTRVTRSRATPVPAARSEPAKTRARPIAKPKATTTTTRAPSRTKMRSTEEEDADDPLDSIELPEAPAPPQRMRRTRAATATVKEEEVDAQVPGPNPVPGKTKNATTATARRRAATVVDKENTPSSSKEDESEKKKEVEVKRPIRTTRSRA